jgi:HTH-type transcriptional regulator/antitoxin HigA
MKPKVLKTERDYKAALAHVETFMAKSSPDAADLELWSLLVEKYEEEHFPIATPDPIEAIRFRMEQAGLESADLHPYLQSKSKVSEVMNRRRPLSLSMIRALHRGLQIPAEVLVQESQAPYLVRGPKPRKQRRSA